MKHGWVVFLAFVCGVGLVSAQQAPSGKTLAEHPGSALGSDSKGAPDELVVDGKVVGKRVPARPGEICALCNHPIDTDDSVYLVHGQRLPIHTAEVDASAAGRLKEVIAQLRPRGAFLGAEPGPSGLSQAWFFFGGYVLIGLVFAAMCAHRALHAGHNPVLWFGAGLVFNVFGYLALLTQPRREVIAPAGIPSGLKKISATYAPEACAKCGFTNHPSAIRCLGCGAALAPRTTSEVARIGQRQN